MEATAGERLCIVEMVAKYGEVYVTALVGEAAEYLLTQGNGFIVSAK